MLFYSKRKTAYEMRISDWRSDVCSSELGPERTMAAIAWTVVAADQLLHAFVPPEFATLDTGHLAIDLFGASATTALALYAHRFWPLCVAVLHMLPLLAHTSRDLDVTIQPDRKSTRLNSSH